MNPSETVFKTPSAIKKNLELVAKASAYLNFLKNASTGEHLNLELGDQLRATNDYNGSLFEVVKKPYWAVVNNLTGTLSDYAYQSFTKTFTEGEEEELEKFWNQKLKEDYDSQYSDGLGVCDVVKEEGITQEAISDDEDDEDTGHFRGFDSIKRYYVRWRVRSIPENCRRETRVWVRKICLISKAEGLVDDKNLRSLVISQKTAPFTDLIKQQIELLGKLSRSLTHTRPKDDKSRKMSGWLVNHNRCEELHKLFCNPALKDKTLTAYANTKYGLFLRNPVTYTITASGKNVVTQATEKLIDAKTEVTKTAVAKDSLVKQIKSLKRSEECLITDD